LGEEKKKKEEFNFKRKKKKKKGAKSLRNRALLPKREKRGGGVVHMARLAKGEKERGAQAGEEPEAWYIARKKGGKKKRWEKGSPAAQGGRTRSRKKKRPHY